MLQDGLTYADIIAKLGDIGKQLNKDNLSRWRKADHQDWLAEQSQREALRGRPEPPPEVKDLFFLIPDQVGLAAAQSEGSHQGFARRKRIVSG